jgi:hypothetical protein
MPGADDLAGQIGELRADVRHAGERLGRIETKLDQLGGVPEALAELRRGAGDREARLREVERSVSWAKGSSAIISAVVGFCVAYLRDKLL